MSFIDDFIYKVKTGRLFSGLKEPEKSEEPEKPAEINKPVAVSESGKEPNKDTGDLKPGPEKPEETVTVIQPSGKKQIGPDVVIHFVCMNKTYVVENFNLNFRQDVDTLKNRPNSFTYGGAMQITLSGFLDSGLDDWITQTYSTRSGEIRFFPNMPKITDSSLLTVFFSDAYCTAYKKTIDAATFGVLTTLTIFPQRIRLGNEEFENIRKGKESLSFSIKSV